MESKKIQSQMVLDASPKEAAWGLNAPTMVHKPVGKAIHLFLTSVLDEEDFCPVSFKKDVFIRLSRTHLDFRANPGWNGSTSTVG